MKEKISYNIHNILKIEINRIKKLELLRDLNLRFTYFEVDNVKNPDIILNLGPFKPENKDCTIIDHKYYIKNNYFYCKESEENAKWDIYIDSVRKVTKRTTNRTVEFVFPTPLKILATEVVDVKCTHHDPNSSTAICEATIFGYAVA